MLEFPRTRTPVPTRRSQEQRYQDASKKTEGLELGAVDKLAGWDLCRLRREGGENLCPHSLPTILFILSLLTYNNVS